MDDIDIKICVLWASKYLFVHLSIDYIRYKHIKGRDELKQILIIGYCHQSRQKDIHLYVKSATSLCILHACCCRCGSRAGPSQKWREGPNSRARQQQQVKEDDGAVREPRFIVLTTSKQREKRRKDDSPAHIRCSLVNK